MIKTLVFLTALALVQARPNDDVDQTNTRIYEFHEDCPPAEVHFLLPHEYDCTKFYYCEYGLKWIEPRDCAPGTEFNAEIQVCVHPVSSGCTLPGFSSTSGPAQGTTWTTAPPTIAPTAAPTTAAPITAAPTTAAPATAAPTTAAPATAAPTTAAPATAAPTTAAPATAAPTTAAPATAAPTTLRPTTVEVTARPTAAPSTSAPATTANPDDCEILDNGCPADFSVHKLLPHEEYCHKFYYCDKGQLVPKYCPVGTYFNPTLEICDWPHNVDCVNDGSYEYPSTSAPATQPPPGDGDNDIGDVLENGCPADFDVHHLLPHETECNKFYYCVFGEKVERICAPGTYFNYEIQVCDWPFNVNCTSSGTTPGVATGTTPAGDDTSSSEEISLPSDPENPQDPIEWVPLPNGCPANFEVHHLLPHESECEKFYYCINGQTLERECPPGTHFSPSQQICDWPQYAGCEHWTGGCSGPGNDNGGCTGSTAAPGGTDRPTAAPGSTDGTTAAPGVTDGPTAAPGVTDGPTAAPGVTDRPTAAPGSTDGTTAAPGVTDGPTAAPGGNDGTTAAPGGTDGPTATPGGNDGTTTAPGCDNCLPVTPADRCKSGCNVLPFAHDNDCDKYWLCNGDQALLVTCSEGLHFNPSTYTCDFICTAGCLRENVQITTLTEGVKLFLPWGSITSEMMSLLSDELNAEL